MDTISIIIWWSYTAKRNFSPAIFTNQPLPLVVQCTFFCHLLVINLYIILMYIQKYGFNNLIISLEIWIKIKIWISMSNWMKHIIPKRFILIFLLKILSIINICMMLLRNYFDRRTTCSDCSGLKMVTTPTLLFFPLHIMKLEKYSMKF